VKLITVIDAATLCDNVAVTVTLESVEEAKARQISAVPLWTLVLTTRTQVSPPPAMLETLMFVPDE
jgi:hypothetical protein